MDVPKKSLGSKLDWKKTLLFYSIMKNYKRSNYI